jgi:hypothetical protein
VYREQQVVREYKGFKEQQFKVYRDKPVVFKEHKEPVEVRVPIPLKELREYRD